MNTSIKNNENKKALVWFAEEIKKYEDEKGHARIVVDIHDGSCHNAESAKKVLFKKD